MDTKGQKATAKKLKELTRLNTQITQSITKTGNGNIPAEQGFKKTASLVEKFESIKSTLPEIKLDTETGEYFPAKDETGREIFRVRVVRTSVVDVYDVPACNAEVAILKALRLKDVKPVRWSFTPAKAEIVCGNEE